MNDSGRLDDLGIPFKNEPKKFLFFCYLIFMISLVLVGIFMYAAISLYKHYANG